MGTGSFPGVKRPGRGVNPHPHPAPKLKIELYLLSLSLSLSLSLYGKLLGELRLLLCSVSWMSI